jgi:hypothetical protein
MLVQSRPQFHYSRIALDFSGSALRFQSAKSRMDLYLVNKAGAAFWKCGSCEFECSLRSVMAHGIIYVHPKRWPYLLEPKIQVYYFKTGNISLMKYS